MSADAAVAVPAAELVRPRHLVEGEAIVVETHPSRWVAFPLPVAVLAIMGVLLYAAAAAVWPTLLPFPGLTRAIAQLRDGWSLHTYVLGLFGLLTIAVGLWFLVRYVRWWSTVYAVTDHRILVQRGFFSRRVDEIPVDQIRGVDAIQSLGERILGFGTIRISSEAGRGIGNEDWQAIPHPFEFQRAIESMVQGQSLPHLLRNRAVPSVAVNP